MTKFVKNHPLLTVIVPCYNVEDYIDRSVLSIVNQTYTNLEILLVNDGSTDKTGMICDSWQEKDQRIRVIHKPNEGVSIARNIGIENATADYVAFVDSDDRIDVNMYANMMSALLSTDSDIAHCDLCFVHEYGRTEYRVQERHAETMKIMGRVEGVVMILGDHKWLTHVGTKIYKKELFDNIEFPKGRAFAEDLIVNLLFHQASQSVYLNNEYYFYLQRSGSACKIDSLQKELKTQSYFFDAYFERYTFVKQHPEYHSALPYTKCMTAAAGIVLLHYIHLFPQYFADGYFKVVSEQMRSIPLTCGDKLKRSFKIELYILKISPKLFKIIRSFIFIMITGANKLKLTKKQAIPKFEE